MKQPWEVVFDEYFIELGRGAEHDMALAEACLAMVYDLKDRCHERVPRSWILAALELLDEWNAQGDGDRIRLRESLRSAWADSVLRRGGRRK